MAKEKTEPTYSLQLTERQARLLSYACDRFSRLICGQDWTYQELFEEAWEKRAKEATGESFDKEFEGGWYKAREDAEELSAQIKKRFWGLGRQSLYGVHYDDTADILFDLHCVIRYQLWEDNPNPDKPQYTVDAEKPFHAWGSEPLATITTIKKVKR